MVRKALFFSAITVILTLTAAYAWHSAEPLPSMFPNVSTAEMKFMMDREEGLVVVDARTADKFYRGHLPGAVNIPPNKLEHIVDFLPEGKDTHVVFYSRGFGWMLCINAAVAARKAGFENLTLYQAGFSAWYEVGHPVENGLK